MQLLHVAAKFKLKSKKNHSVKMKTMAFGCVRFMLMALTLPANTL